MEKIKNMLKGISEKFRQLTVLYPFTVTLAVLVSVIVAVFVDQSGKVGKFMEEKTIPFLLLWWVGTWFTETYWRQNRSLRWAGTAISCLIALGFVWLGSSDSPLVREISSRWLKAYVPVLALLGIYCDFKASNLRFNQYCINVIYGLSRLAIIGGVVSLGIAPIMATFVTLILNGTHFMLIIRAELFVFCLFIGIGLPGVLIGSERELSRFFIMIVKNLLMILLISAFMIIYAYILKIVITRVVPSNEIFRILAGLFIIGTPIWTMIGTFEKDSPLVSIGTKLPYIFIPFLFLQGYAIRERILAYGFTPLRCLCLVLMLLEILYIVVYAFRNKETGILLPAAAVLTVICLLFPWINIYSISNRSQKAIFDRNIQPDFSSLSSDEQSSLAGAYYYLAGNEEGKRLLSDVDPEKISAIVDSGKIGIQEYDQNIYFYRDFPVLREDISSFDMLTMVTTMDPEFREDINYDPEAVRFFTNDGTYLLTADLRRFIDAGIISRAVPLSEAQELPYLIELGEGNFLRVLSGSFTVHPDHSIHYLDINGMLLEKTGQNSSEK